MDLEIQNISKLGHFCIRHLAYILQMWQSVIIFMNVKWVWSIQQNILFTALVKYHFLYPKLLISQTKLVGPFDLTRVTCILFLSFTENSAFISKATRVDPDLDLYCLLSLFFWDAMY